MKDLHDGTYCYKTFKLEELIPPEHVGDLIAIATDNEARATTYVAAHINGTLAWQTLQRLDLKTSKESP